MNAEYEIEILLVEDSPYDAELTIRELTRRNLANKLVHLKDGAEALEFIFGTGAYAGRDTSQHPKVMLLDLKLPKVDGLEVLRAMKSDPRTRTIPVVIMRSEEHTSELQSRENLVCRLLLEKKKPHTSTRTNYALLRTVTYCQIRG